MPSADHGHASKEEWGRLCSQPVLF
jgi:hypothetical protein